MSKIKRIAIKDPRGSAITMMCYSSDVAKLEAKIEELTASLKNAWCAMDKESYQRYEKLEGKTEGL